MIPAGLTQNGKKKYTWGTYSEIVEWNGEKWVTLKKWNGEAWLGEGEAH
jgi:hypothetical protein